MTNTIHDWDSLRVRVTVEDPLGDPVNLTSATMACYFGKLGAIGVQGTVESVDLPNGVVDIVFPVGSAEGPTSVAQLKVTLDGETQTVYSEPFKVKQTIRTS